MENIGLITKEDRLLPLADILLDEELAPVDGLVETAWLPLGDRAGKLFVTVLVVED